MLKNLLKKKEGFTLVEIIIVLAIVGLIFVIVFLAVAAAQRGQRDTSRKDNVNRFVSQITQVAGDANGTNPSPTANACGSGTCSFAIAGVVPAWKFSVASPVTTVAAAPTKTALGWGLGNCPTVINPGSTGHVSITLDDNTTIYCKEY